MKSREMQKEDLTYFNVRTEYCNTRSAKSCIAKPEARHRNVLTYIKDMLTHINAICLYISGKIRTFA